MIQGIKAVTRELNKFLKAENFDCVAGFGPDFQYWTGRNKINWSLLVAQTHDELFKKLCYEDLGLKHECDIFILNFFHELGHNQTDILLTESQQTSYANMLEYFESKDDLTDKDVWDYFNSYNEKLATRWAVRYINENPDKIKKFWDRVQPKILRVYELNNITDN